MVIRYALYDRPQTHLARQSRNQIFVGESELFAHADSSLQPN